MFVFIKKLPCLTLASVALLNVVGCSHLEPISDDLDDTNKRTVTTHEACVKGRKNADYGGQGTSVSVNGDEFELTIDLQINCTEKDCSVEIKSCTLPPDEDKQ